MTRWRIARLMVFFVVLLQAGHAVPDELRPFTSDGCSLFPDGNLKDRTLWCDCCLAHDIAYWRGGTKEERRKADTDLRDCVLKRTNSKTLAQFMYDGVRAGGHPAFPTWYRWGYGWPYGRGYVSLTGAEQEQVRRGRDEFTKEHSGGYCRDKSGVKAQATHSK